MTVTTLVDAFRKIDAELHRATGYRPIRIEVTLPSALYDCVIADFADRYCHSGMRSLTVAEVRDQFVAVDGVTIFRRGP